jgi:hypothetical protein
MQNVPGVLSPSFLEVCLETGEKCTLKPPLSGVEIIIEDIGDTLIKLDEVINVLEETEADTWADLKAIDFITALKDHFCKQKEK